MPLKVNDEAEALILEGWVKSSVIAWPARIRLYKNDIAPGPSVEFADYVPADFTGSTAIPFTPSEWAITPDVSGRAKAVYGSAALQWENEGAVAQTVYGYLVENDDGDKVVWAERFAAPIVVEPAGFVQVWPEVTLRSEY